MTCGLGLLSTKRLLTPRLCRCLYQVLCAAVSEQTLLKTVTQVFSEAELSNLSNHSDSLQSQPCPLSASGPTWSTEHPSQLCQWTNCVCVCVCDSQIQGCTMRSCSRSFTLVTSTSLAPPTGGHCPGRCGKVGGVLVTRNFAFIRVDQVSVLRSAEAVVHRGLLPHVLRVGPVS